MGGVDGRVRKSSAVCGRRRRDRLPRFIAGRWTPCAALLRSAPPAVVIIGTAGVLVAIFALTVMLPMIGLLENLTK